MLVKVRWVAATASRWQKWGFHARLVANAVLLIWPASKGPGRRLESPSLPAEFGSLPFFGPPHMSECNNAAAPLPPWLSPSSHTLNMCIIIFLSTINIGLLPYSQPTLLIFIHLVCEEPTSLPFFIQFQSRFSKNRTKEDCPSLFAG